MATLLHQGSPLRTGVDLLRAGKLAEALELFERAVRDAPNDARAYFFLGTIYARRQEQPAALVAFRECLKRDPSSASSIAEQAAQAALAIDPDCLEAELWLATRAEHAGDRNQLEYHGRRALEIDPSHLATYYFLARSGLVEREELERQLNGLSAGDSGELHLRFALGHVLDREGVYEQAFQNFQRANECVGARFDRVALAREFEHVAQSFDAHWLERHTGIGASKLEPLFLVGLPRTGSSLLEQMLGCHPELHALGEVQAMSAAISALDVWPVGIHALDKRSAIAAAQQYEQALGVLPAHTRVVTDKTLGNIGRLPLIAALFPRARVIHCCRDARDSSLSAYFLHFEGNNCPWTYDLDDLAFTWRLFTDHVERWQAVGTLPFMEVHYEDLVCAPEQTLRSVLAFAGLDWADECLAFDSSTRTVITSSAAQVRQPVHRRSIARYKPYAEWIAPLLALA